jgi:GNAT superfamily N-acetyltransferase
MPNSQLPPPEQILEALDKANSQGNAAAVQELKQMYLESQAQLKAQSPAPSQPSSVPPMHPNAQPAKEKAVPLPAGAANAPSGFTPEGSSFLSVPQQKDVWEVSKAVGTGTGVGAALGAASPEIMQGAGKALQLWGPGRAAGMMVEDAGRGMRLHRASMAVNGAVSGAVSEAAGQAAEAGGAGPKTALGVRMAAGVATPAVKEGATMAVAAFIPNAVKNAWAAVVKVAGTEQKLTETAVAQAKRLLSSNPFTTIPQHDLHVVLQKGVEADLKAAETAAGKALQDAHVQAAKVAAQDEKQAQQLIAEGKQKADFIRESAKARAATLDKATEGQLQRAERVSKQAEPALKEVGTPHEVSDIGKALREKVSKEQQQLIQQREVEFKQLKQQRDIVVQQREAAGQFVDSVPAMKELKLEISQKLLLTQGGRKAAEGKAAVTEPGVMRAYQSIYDAVANRRVQSGVNAEGNPTFETFKTTFEALDHVRRKLGDAGWGKPSEEGYGALGQGIAKDMYAKISKIQKDYVGGDLQSKLQAVYAEGSEKLQKFGTASGKKMTAVDRFDPEVFAKDPAGVPKAYFQSQQGVRDLLELTGDPKLVADAAGSFAARSVAGMNAKQVKAWSRENSDWLREVPGRAQLPKGREATSVTVQTDYGSGHPDYAELVTKPVRAALRSGNYSTAPLKDGGQVRLVRGANSAGDEGSVYAFNSAGEEIGSVAFPLTRNGEHPSVEVTAAYRRRGVASALYDEAERMGGKISGVEDAGAVRTQEGKAFREGRAAKKPQSGTSQSALQSKLQGYAEKLSSIERYSEDAAGRVAAVQKRKNGMLQDVGAKTATTELEGLKAAAALREGAPVKQTAATEVGAKAARLVRQEAEAKAAAVLPKGDSPPDTVRKLLTGSSLDGLKHTVRYIAGNPGGKKVLEGSVRNLLAQESPKQIAKLWNERLYEVIKEGGLMDKGALAKLDTDVQRVLRAEVPETEKQRLLQKMFAGAVATTGNVGVAAGRMIGQAKEDRER